MTRAIAFVLIAAVAGGSYFFFRDTSPTPPSPDLAGREDQVREKLEGLREAAAEKPDDASRWFEYGRCLQAHELFREAQTCYEVSAQDEKLAFDSHYLTGVLMRNRDPEVAEAAFAKAAALRDDYLPLHVRRGELAEKRQDFESARDHYETALALSPSSHALLGLGRVALEKEDAEGAREHLERALRIDPGHAEVYAILAAACTRLGDTTAAQRYGRQAERIEGGGDLSDPIALGMLLTSNSIGTYIGAARAALAQTPPSPENALHYAEKAIAIRDDVVQPHRLRAQALVGLKRTEDAVAALRRVLELEPENVEAISNIGGLQLELGNQNKAAQAFKHALSIDPFHTNTLYLFSVLIWRHSPAEGESLVRRAIESDAEDIPSHLHLATILAAVGKADEAETSVREVLRLSPRHPRARSMLRILLEEKKKR